MEAVRKLEVALVSQYKKAPHLPEGGRKWLAENGWWIVLIGVVLSVFGIFGILSALALATFGLGLTGAALGAGYGAAAGVALGGVLLVATLLSLALFVIEVVVLGMAVAPLKTLKKRGWDLVFLVVVLNVVFGVVTNVISVNLIGAIFTVLWAAVGAYFLFEVRDRFNTKVVATKPVKPAKEVKA